MTMAGFGGVIRVGFISLDWHLVTALVERWRPETHTFHLPHGEATITLQDVSILFGLPVDGEPVSGLVGADVATECERLLGIVPPATAVKGNTLKMSWLGLTFQNFPADGDDITAQRYARAYILQLMGGLLFTSKTSTHVHICFLSLLENLYAAGQYSWGSASLAWLYREMCHATHLDASEIAGPLILLQVWAWERLPFLAPRRETDIPWDNLCPLGARWRVKFKVTQIGHNVVSWYREMLDRMSSDQIGDVLGVAHGHAAHTTEYNEWYRRISRRYLTRVGLIHADPAPSHSTHSTSSSSLSSQRRRRSRTDVPGPSVSYGRVDADVRPSDVYIPSPAHMSPPPPPPYMASSSSMYHQLMPDFALQSSEVFNSPIPQVPYFQYGNTPASYDPGMGSGVQAEEGFSGVDDIPPSDDLGDRADVPARRNPARRRRPRPCGTGGHFL
ncbi:serine/threonine-protein phosphatase 7 long form-like [Quillaja saponaria]|nr:serine/threonine-protein phosphatase 7 long form-like [Quillaja saponaria]